LHSRHPNRLPEHLCSSLHQLSVDTASYLLKSSVRGSLTSSEQLGYSDTASRPSNGCKIKWGFQNRTHTDEAHLPYLGLQTHHFGCQHQDCLVQVLAKRRQVCKSSRDRTTIKTIFRFRHMLAFQARMCSRFTSEYTTNRSDQRQTTRRTVRLSYS